MITRYYSVTCDRCWLTAEILDTPSLARKAVAKLGWLINVPYRQWSEPGEMPSGKLRDFCPACRILVAADQEDA